jgi:tetratricopeptide (TPR) repeat protein
MCGHFSHFLHKPFTQPVHMGIGNRIAFVAAMLLLSLGLARIASAGSGEDQVCDVNADYALGVEDYPEAIRLHAEVVREHPENVLAHYHLGFADGMTGNKAAELSEYQLAAALGLRNWDLFLNLGLAQLENGDLAGATDNLRRAVLLGENHSEAHFNLAVAYERGGLLADAERETLTSLRLNPRQPDASNLLGVIYAEEGKTVRASSVWRELMRAAPGYAPARTNLALLAPQTRVPLARRRWLPPTRLPSIPPIGEIKVLISHNNRGK